MNHYNPYIHHRRSVRLKDYDYSKEGLYFITICTKDRECLFGNIIEDSIILNDVGEIILKEWLNTEKIRKNIVLHDFVIMPNHIHCIIEILYNNVYEDILSETSVGAYCIRPHDIRCKNNDFNNNQYEIDNVVIKGELFNEGVCNTPLPLDKPNMKFQSPKQTIGSIIRGFKSAVTKQLGYSLWQRNYFEHIIRNEKSYNRISNYIKTNPSNWGKDKLYI